MRVPIRKPGKYTGGPDDHHLTPEKIHAMEAAIRRIEEEELPQARKDVSAAREMGDLSENAAYTEAKARMRRLEGRVLSLKERLKHAVIIESGAAADGSARIGSTVTVRVNGKEKTYAIVGSQETDPSKGRISHLSPLGELLVGVKAGETVVLERDGREIAYEVLKVE